MTRGPRSRPRARRRRRGACAPLSRRRSDRSPPLPSSSSWRTHASPRARRPVHRSPSSCPTRRTTRPTSGAQTGCAPGRHPRLPRAARRGKGGGADRTSSPGRSASEEAGPRDTRTGGHGEGPPRGSVEARCDATRARRASAPTPRVYPPTGSRFYRLYRFYPPTGSPRARDGGGARAPPSARRRVSADATVRSTRTCSSGGRTRLFRSEEFPPRYNGGRGPRRPR
mmetsp:Transcript_2884/g.12901  ORF Transcript_2884/g.12901 Transcript_2884/m.12901 type:complete len:226 (-) Transcript_2884:763-1440(-)